MTASNLRKLTIDFDSAIEYEGGPIVVGPPEMSWLQDYPNHMDLECLYDLFIEFYPNVSPLEMSQEGFPSDRL